MALGNRKLVVELVGDTSSLEKAFGKGGKSAEGFGGKMQKASGIAKGAFVGGLAIAGAGAKKAMDAASDLGEQVSKTGVVFGHNGKEVVSWSGGLTKNFGLSQRAALEAAGTFGNMLVPMGFARGKAADMSKGMVELAGDMASFNNASPEETLDALRAGLAGETEPLRRFGVFLNDSRLKQEALKMGLKDPLDKNGNLTAAAKAAATYSIILKDTKDTQGDFKRTSDSVANQQRIVAAETENLAAKFGTGLLPVARAVLGVTVSMVEWMGKHKTATLILAGVVGALTGAVAAYSVGTKVVAAVTGLWTGAQAALNAVMALNPLVLVTVAIAALVAGLIIAYKSSETFRNIVNGAFDAVKSVALDVFGWLKGAVIDVVGFLSARWENIKSAVSWYWSTYKTLIINPIRAAFDWLREAVGNVVGWLGNRWGDIKSAASAAWGLVKTYIVTPVRDGIGVVRSVVGAVVGWLGERWETLKSNARAAWDAFKSHILNPVHTAVEGVKDLIGKGKEGLITWLGDRVGDIKKAAEALAKPFVAAFKAMTDGVKKLLEWLGKIVDAVKDVISLIGKIKVPHIDLPSLPFIGGSGGGNVGPGGGAPSSVQGFDDDAAAFGLSMTSGYRPGDDGWHGQNRARDYSNGWATAAELMFARYMASNFGGKLLELIHTPLGFGIKNGQTVPLSFWGGAVNSDHFDHVHVAMANGGVVRARVGETGPEDVYLPTGARVVSASATKGGGDVYVDMRGARIGSQRAAKVMANRIAHKVAF